MYFIWETANQMNCKKTLETSFLEYSILTSGNLSSTLRNFVAKSVTKQVIRCEVQNPQILNQKSKIHFVFHLNLNPFYLYKRKINSQNERN